LRQLIHDTVRTFSFWVVIFAGVLALVLAEAISLEQPTAITALYAADIGWWPMVLLIPSFCILQLAWAFALSWFLRVMLSRVRRLGSAQRLLNSSS
jgi:hypothetical protein